MSENSNDNQSGGGEGGALSDDELFEKVREKVLETTVGGSVMGLSTVFCNIDKDGSKRLNIKEFTEGMRMFGLLGADKTLKTEADVKRLFRRFDVDGSGTVDFNEFVHALPPPLKACRRRLVLYVFDYLDIDKNGFLTSEDIEKNEYFAKSAALHPKYKKKEWSLQDVYKHFINTFDDKANPDGRVSRDEFVAYYAMVSVMVDRDDAFDLMMCKAFNLPRNKVIEEVNQFDE